MSDITVAGVTLHVKRFSGWSYPSFGSLVRLLSDGSSVDNETLQTGSLPRRRATITAFTHDSGDIVALDALNASKEQVTFDEDGGSRGAHVLDFSFERSFPWRWDLSLTLVEAADES